MQLHAAGHARGLSHPRLYDALLTLITHGRERDYRTRLLDLAQLEPGERVLDIGCGTGTLARGAASRVGGAGEVQGVDISPAMVARARALAARGPHDAQLDFQVAEATSLPFEDERFDVVLITTVMHMIPEPDRHVALSEAARVLRPSGRLLVADYGGSARRGFVAQHGLHRSFNLSSLDPSIAAAGLNSRSHGALGWLSLDYLLATKPDVSQRSKS